MYFTTENYFPASMACLIMLVFFIFYYKKLLLVNCLTNANPNPFYPSDVSVFHLTGAGIPLPLLYLFQLCSFFVAFCVLGGLNVLSKFFSLTVSLSLTLWSSVSSKNLESTLLQELVNCILRFV